MCLAIPGKVVEIKEDVATIDYNGEKREAKIADVSVTIGDYVIVQFGYVMAKLDKEEALKSLEEWSKVR